MSKLTYKIEDRVIAKVLGIQNFTTDEAAVLELVKNAYDAGATKVDLSFSKSCFFNSSICSSLKSSIYFAPLKKCFLKVFFIYLTKALSKYGIEQPP